MSDSVGQRLPLELLYLVFEHLRKPALSACSLVSRAWLDPARSYLFKVFKYITRGVYEWDIDNHPDFVTPLEDLLHFLDSTPSIRLHIHSLVLEMEISWHPSSPGAESIMVGGQLDTLHAILCHTPNLQKLALNSFALEAPNPALRVPALAHLKVLQVGRFLQEDRIKGVSYILHVMGLVASVGKLIINTFPDILDYNARLTSTTSWRARELLVSHYEVAQGLQDLAGFNSLESIDIAETEPTLFVWLSDYLRTTGSGLQHLGVSIHDRQVFENDQYVYPIDALHMLALQLPALKKLRSLSMELPVLVLPPPHPSSGANLHLPVYNVLLDVIPSLPSCLRTITFQLDYRFGVHGRENHYPLAILQNNWSMLDSVIERRIVDRGLQSVVITEAGLRNGLTEAERQTLAKLLPRVQSRGVLQFEDRPNLWWH